MANPKLNALALARLRGQEAAQAEPAAAAATAQGPRPIAAIIADLSRHLPERHIRTRTQGGIVIPYIEWHTAVKYLDHFAPGWCSEVRALTAIGGRCVVVVRLTLPTAEGPVWREATGAEDEEVKGYGDPSSNAEAMALKRAAAKFGLGLYLYAAK